MPVFAPVTTAILSLKSVAHPILILPIILFVFLFFNSDFRCSVVTKAVKCCGGGGGALALLSRSDLCARSILCRLYNFSQTTQEEGKFSVVGFVVRYHL